MIQLKILVVDDSATVRRIIKSTLQKYLESQGLQLVLSDASNGVGALRKLQEEEFDLINSDLEMPEMGGNQLLEEVKADPKLCHIPFLMVTNRNDRDTIVTAVQAGVSDYLIKPFTSLDLVGKVQRLVKKFEQRLFERHESKRQSVLSFKYGDNCLKGTLIDVSMGGLLGRFSIPPEPLITKVVTADVQIIGDTPLTIGGLQGVVLRLEADFQAGANMCKIAIRFLLLPPEKISELTNFVNSLKAIEPGLSR